MLGHMPPILLWTVDVYIDSVLHTCFTQLVRASFLPMYALSHTSISASTVQRDRAAPETGESDARALTDANHLAIQYIHAPLALATAW